ncbi:NAD(P)/FAD-dependent oxidoreductase [Carboxylicivirga linearis]|uniref:FAD-binding oxidoreductase n=1 Tax=Carboxylicivirga linearis TaxID=1628157 RepID=A0ABS5JRN2_9BACT|nr:FAD-binding oxidoreductase [Carboxylicivirga linearis]MBS2097061.1 FAD-binding oxidoreductase [Carboxylicivirga linearis]
MSLKTDILIVGQGLAGTLLSYQLYKNKIHHLVIDKPSSNSASKVAAGLINPIGIKRMVKSWNVDLFLPYAHSLYQEMEQFLEASFFHPKLMDKIYGEKDKQFWQHRLGKGLLHDYIDPDPKNDLLSKNILAPYGYGQIKKGARLDMLTFLKAYRSFLNKSKLLIEDDFNDKDLQIFDKSVHWKNIEASKVIFCRGEKDSLSPIFTLLNFRNTKGELLDIELPNLKLKNILLKGIFILPVEKDLYKMGATFEHEWNNLNPTPNKKQELLDKWASISTLQPKIIQHLTGIRPTMHDRRPVLGFLPENPSIGIFNGLGSRGSLLAPYLSHQFALLLKEKTDQIFKEVKVERYFKQSN